MTNLQGKFFFDPSPVLLLRLDCMKVWQVDHIWPYSRHGCPTDTTETKTDSVQKALYKADATRR